MRYPWNTRHISGDQKVRNTNNKQRQSKTQTSIFGKGVAVGAFCLGLDRVERVKEGGRGGGE